MTAFNEQINAILDELSSATSEELETALGKYDTRDWLAVVAKRLAAGSGGGGSPSEVLVARKTITSAEILNCFTSPVEVIAAPGSGRAIILASLTFQLSGVTTTYTVASQVALSVLPLGVTATWFGFTYDLANSGDTVKIVDPAGIGVDATFIDNQAVAFVADVADPTGGDGDVTLTLLYFLADLA